MPSQKQSKRRRHEPAAAARTKSPGRVPRPPVAAGPGRRHASTKVLLIAGGALVAAIAVGAAAVALSGGSSGSADVPAVGSLSNALPGAAEVQKLFRGIPQDGSALGSPSAPVTIIEYADLQCPYCREFEASVLPSIVSGYVRPGKARIEQRLLAFIGPDSARGRNAALAAGRQGKQFNVAALLYFNQGTENTGWLDRDTVERTAASIPGLQVPALLSAANSGAISAAASTLDAEAKEAAVSLTPTLLVGRTGGTPHEVELASPGDVKALRTAVEAALAGS